MAVFKRISVHIEGLFFIFRCLIIFSICLSSVCFAQVTAQPLLWQVDDKHSQSRVYLFGSLHYGAEYFYPLPASVMTAYAKADSLAVELDIDAIPIAQLQQVVQKQGYYQDDKKLSVQASEKLWEKFTQRCEQLSVNPQNFARAKPWLAAMQLANLQVSSTGYQQSLGLDRHFLNLARNKKPIIELESLSDQMQLFAQLNEVDQLQFLESTLDEFAKGERSLRELADAWHKGDEKTLHTLVFNAFRMQEIGKKLYPLVFVERNKHMMEKITTYMQSSQKIFLVVGIGHMLGDDGLVMLLQQKGYRVTKVDTSL